MESEDPPPKIYGFKERDFKRDNSLAVPATPLPTARELAIMAGQVTRQTPANPGALANDPNDVYKVLEKNRAAAKASGLDQVEIRRIKSRRWRDYWLIMIPSQLLLGAITVVCRDNPIIFVSAFAGMILVGVTVTWIMWQIVGRY